ncbi:MAG: hypothetical protein H0V22_05720 [Solirubrobacterales bacterium]|nr:hypothetical protein [Solirubrobacterales bacterium]
MFAGRRLEREPSAAPGVLDVSRPRAKRSNARSSSPGLRVPASFTHTSTAGSFAAGS